MGFPAQAGAARGWDCYVFHHHQPKKEQAKSIFDSNNKGPFCAKHAATVLDLANTSLQALNAISYMEAEATETCNNDYDNGGSHRVRTPCWTASYA